MSKITIEIEDTLQDRVDSAIEDVKDELLRYCDESEPDKLPCISNDLDYSGTIHEIVDGSVPIYTKEISDTWYLHGNALEEAYENAGVGDNPKENNGLAAIYFYIHEQVNEWYNDHAEDIFEEWQAKHRAKKLAGIEIFEVTAGDFLNAEAGSWQFEIIDTEVKRLNSEGFYGEDRIREIIEDTAKASAGFYWWSCQPGCLPDGEANGPFETAEEAEEDVLAS
jgi:hypothetical protein